MDSCKKPATKCASCARVLNLGPLVLVSQCGLATYPGHVGLLILNANFLMEVKRDGPAARTQLQLAGKGNPRCECLYVIDCGGWAPFE